MIKIGIIGAMDLEVDQLKKEMSTLSIVTKAGMDFHEGTLNGTPAVVVRCGIGKVNAALCVQILADLFQVTHIINTGVAGSLNAGLDIGDILISKDALYHDMDVTVFGYRPGEVPQMGFREFTADPLLARLAKTACERVNPDINAVLGRVVSGDQFISSKEGTPDHRIPGGLRGDGGRFHCPRRLSEPDPLCDYPRHFGQGRRQRRDGLSRL